MSDKYTQVSNWDCGVTCIAWLADKDPDAVREMAKEEENWEQGIDPYELEKIMDKIGLVYQPIIVGELNLDFIENEILLIMMAPGKEDVEKSGNHWVVIDKGFMRDPLVTLNRLGGGMFWHMNNKKILRAYTLKTGMRC